MNGNMQNVKQAKESFNRVLDNKIYTGIIKDDEHLSLLLSLINDGNYSKIADIGTGTGYLAFPLAEQFPSAGVCGIDIADVIVEKNNAAVREKGISNLLFQVFDGLKYPFSNESIDLIVSRYAFHHFPDAAYAVRQMNRVLVKGGKVLVSDPMRNENDDNRIIDSFMRVKKDGHIQFYSADELDQLFTDHGFIKENQVITALRFPFAKQDAYMELYEQTGDQEKALYDMVNENGVIWVKHISVGNTVFVKQ